MRHEPQERLGRRLFFKKTVKGARKTKTAGNQTNTNVDARRSGLTLHFDPFQNMFDLVLSREGSGSQGRALNSVLFS